MTYLASLKDLCSLVLWSYLKHLQAGMGHNSAKMQLQFRIKFLSLLLTMIFSVWSSH